MSLTRVRVQPLHFLVLVLLFVTVSACSVITGDEEATATSESPAPQETQGVSGEANVESIQVLVLESFPVQVNVIASGELPNGCTSLNEPAPRQEGNTFVVNLTTTRLEDEVCTEAVVPYDKVIPLDVQGLEAGTYTVAVNGVTDSFTLEMDNVAQEEPPPEEEPTGGAEVGEISGQVWHDLCAVAGGEGGEETVPSDGCVSLEDGGYQANGALEEEEPGIEDITVTLGQGECPSTGLDSATTAGNGAYSFAGLSPGTYCVTVDALAEGNGTILVPGQWTAPEVADDSGAASATVDVVAGATSDEINFGWDYQFLPEPEESTASKDCSDEASFVADVTVLDNEVLPPTFVFTKTWRLENSGTCTWTTDYDLVFAYGDQLGAPDEIPLPTEVAPTSTLDISVPMTAPDVNGTYRSEWLLRNELGETFGIPEPFWAQIVVEADIPESGAYVTGVVWSDLCSVPDTDVEGTPEGCVANDEGGFVADGVYDPGEPRIEGVTLSIGEGACPASEAVNTTTANEDGRYTFTGLEAGTYCVFVDPTSSANESLLVPGTWSWPDVSGEAVGYTIEVVEGDTITDAYFGWDFEFD